jgi:hypothetical protein
MSEEKNTIFDLCSENPGAKEVADFINRRHNNREIIKNFLIKQRGWPKREASMMAAQMTGSIRTIFP